MKIEEKIHLNKIQYSPYKEWFSFEEYLPKINTGLLIKVISDNKDDDYPVKDIIFYGFLWECGYIYLVFDITNNVHMGWKITKSYDYKDIFWLNSSEVHRKVENYEKADLRFYGQQITIKVDNESRREDPS